MALRRTPGPQLVCVYRAKNASHVQALVTQVAGLGGDSFLWALDEVSPQLERWTRGTGPGHRLTLLNRLLADARPGRDLVVSDDDVSFVTGDLRQLLRIVHRARFVLAQPAHAAGSHSTHAVTRAVPQTIARQTRFVEVGPLVVVTAALRDVITPFPEEYEMGWGLDIVWSDLVQRGYRIGVVDRATVHHHGAVGREYDNVRANTLVNRELAARGLEDMGTFTQNLSRWSTRGRTDLRNWVPVWRPVPDPASAAATTGSDRPRRARSGDGR